MTTDQFTNKQKEIFMSNTGRKVNTLSYAEMYKLLRYIELNHADLKGKTQETIAKECGEKLGLTLTISNIRAASETLDIPLGQVSTRKTLIPNDVSRTLARALCDLYKRLGQEVPEVVSAIAHR